nr:hypothetical protein [Tanacetum cinerariifolium]
MSPQSRGRGHGRDHGHNTYTNQYTIQMVKSIEPCYTKPLDSLKNWNNRFFWVDERVFPTVVDWRTSALKEGMLAENTYSAEVVRILDTDRTPIQKQLEALLCLVGLSLIYYLGDEVYPTFLHDDDRDIDLFNLIRAPNPTKVKTGSHPRAAHEVPLLTMTATRMIEVEDPAAATYSSGVPSIIDRSPLDFANEAGPEDQGTMAPKVSLLDDVSTTRGASEAGQAENVAATAPPVVKESRKRGNDGVDANVPLKVLRRDHADPRPTGSTRGGKSLAAMDLGMGSTRPTSMPPSAPVDVSDPDPLSFADPQSHPPADVAYMLDTPKACQDLVDHVVLTGYFSKLRHLHNDDFLRQYNANLARQVAMGSQLRLRFEQEAKLLKKSITQVARRDKRIQAKEHEIKNLEALLEAEADMKKVAEDKSAKLRQELEDSRALFSDLQVSNDHLLQLVTTLQEQVSGEEKLKAAFEEFKQYEDSRVEWMIGRGLRLAVMKCGESLELKQAFADVVLAGIAKGMMDQLEGLKDAPMDVIMAALYLESDTGDVALQWVRELCLSSSQLTILVYPEVRDPLNPWACKEEMLLADAIAANVSHAEKKKKYRVVCRTHGVGSAHHARSDGVPVSVPTVIPQGLAILLADAATQTESDEASQLSRSSSLPIMHS